jgi:hypothetical protein
MYDYQVQDKTGNSRLMVVGCGDGSLRAFDCRQPPRFALVQNFNEHKSWVVNVDIPTLTKVRLRLLLLLLVRGTHQNALLTNAVDYYRIALYLVVLLVMSRFGIYANQRHKCMLCISKYYSVATGTDWHVYFGAVELYKCTRLVK